MNANLDKKILLIVEDEEEVRSGIKEILSSLLDIDILEAHDGKAALEIVKNRAVNAILTDIRLPTMDGLEFISCAKAIGLNIPIIFFSAYADKDNALKALRLGAFEFIEKPFQMSHLVNVVKKALLQENLKLASRLQSLNLSAKQTEILEFLLQGKTNREIANTVKLSEPTVKYHVGELFKQFATTNRFELKEKVRSIIESRTSVLPSNFIAKSAST